MDHCEKCGGKIREEIAHAYEDKLLGLPGVVLIDSVTIGKCEKCGAKAYTTFPNMAGLIATAALARVKQPMKLNGTEIRFLRKALGMKATELAELLGVRSETVSRWENDKEPIGPTSEKLLRLEAWIKLKENAPVIAFDENEVADMKIQSVRSSNRPVRITLQCVAMKRGAKGWDEREQKKRVNERS